MSIAPHTHPGSTQCAETRPDTTGVAQPSATVTTDEDRPSSSVKPSATSNRVSPPDPANARYSEPSGLQVNPRGLVSPAATTCTPAGGPAAVDLRERAQQPGRTRREPR